jgi:iron complex outermembrane recepter protein
MKNLIKHRNVLFAGCVTSALALFAGSAAAQDATAGDEAVRTLDSVTVTATKREKDLQDVAVAVSAVTSDTIEKAGLLRVEDIATLVPNLTYSESTTSRITQLVVRGLSQSGGIGNDPNIGVYIDGVYIGRDSGFNSGLMDIARVEVLKGPQGTLFGRNSATGAISITTRRPDEAPSLEMQSTIGNYNFRRIGVTANGALTDTISAKFTALKTDRDGYLDNSFGGTANGINSTFLRGQVLFEPSADFRLTLSADYSKDDDNGNNYVTAAPGTPVNFDRVTNIPDLGFEKQEQYGVAATLEYEFGNGYELTSITSQRSIDFSAFNDNDYSPLDLSTIGDNREQSQFSQELRIASPESDTLEWVAGLYYYRQAFDVTTNIVNGSDTLFAFGGAFVDPAFFGLIGSGAIPTDFGLPSNSTFIDAIAGIDTDSYAAFASGTYHFNPAWAVTAGIRYSKDQKDFSFSQSSDPLSQLFGFRTFDCKDPASACQTSRDDSKWTPAVSLEYTPNDNILAYAKFSTGYNAGGFNANLNSGTNPLSFEPETVDSYEIGLKSELFEKRVRLNAAVFQLDYNNKQESIFSATAGGFIQGNAGGARSRGFEVELDAILTDHLDLNASVGYADSEYTDYGADTGNRLANAPKWQGNIALQYTRPLTAGLNLFSRGDIFYQDDRFLGSNNDPFFVFDATTLVNFRAGVESSDQRWSVAAWGRNLLNDDSISQIFGGSSFFIPSYSYSPNNPQTYGVDLTLRF